MENGFYHIYNRGVEKRTIFEDDQDYRVFLKNLKEYLSPPLDIDKFQGGTLKNNVYPYRLLKNYFAEISLIAYCLMPNHFHFMIQQKSKRAIKNFMQSLLTRYSMYFNKKYSRVGKLFQGHYKGVLITDESYLLHLSRYIHLNPFEYTKDLESAYSSYSDYLGIRKTPWVKPDIVLTFFNTKILPDLKKINTYKKFVEEYEKDSVSILEHLTLEDS